MSDGSNSEWPRIQNPQQQPQTDVSGWQTVPNAGQQPYAGAAPASPPYPQQQYGAQQPYGAPGSGYVAPGYAPSGYAVVPQKKSHLVRNIVLGVLSLVVLAMVGCGALVYGGLRVLRDSKPTQLAVRTAEESAFVQQRIGTPLKPSLWVTGNVNTNFENGEKTGVATLKINVTGPRGKGALSARETLEASGWKVLSLVYTDSGSEATPLIVNGSPAPHAGSRDETF